MPLSLCAFPPGAVPSRIAALANLRTIQQWRLNMTIRIGDEAPDFTAETTKGTIELS